MQIIIRLLMIFGALLMLASSPVSADSTIKTVIKKSQLLVRPKDASGNIIVTPFMEDPVGWARDQQQIYYGSMSGALKAMKDGSSATAAYTLLLIGFAYGLFHAAGPGHGKVVISSWLLATENDLKRGLIVAFLSSMFQALTAIILVSALYLVVASVGGIVRDVTAYLESASYAMICGIGIYLVFTALRGWVRKPAIQAQTMTTPFPFEIVSPTPDLVDHVHDAHCGHAHTPEPQDLRGDWSLAKALSLSIAIGLRPCTGAILVLLAANAIGLAWVGIAATLAMGFGVFITVSTIAIITVYGKNFAMKLAKGDNQKLAASVRVLKIGGGMAIAFIGGIMFLGSFGQSQGIM
ncbi:MAG: nickel/cobalt transporter [Alphaproteobacteria bacterium]|nr:nickel/cobalt transporter [Alphaproteobacteria bacterium]